MKQDYSRKVELVCPVCGGKTFQYDTDDDNKPVKCILCNSEFTKSELQERNTENIDAHINELKDEVLEDVKEEFKKMFKGFNK